MRGQDTRVQRVCIVCGQSFTRFRSQAPPGYPKHCSWACRHPGSAEERFWSKVQQTDGDGCWLWIAGSDRLGYGRVLVNGRNALAHRVAWELTNGPIPDGLQVLHACDCPPCCRPSHLRLGTVADNMADRDGRGRGRGHGPPGEQNGMARLTEAQVREIRRRYAAGGVTRMHLAAVFGASGGHIGGIIARRSWKHLL